MSYKDLKKIINSISKQNTDEERSDQRNFFFVRVEQELEKVSSFYVAKEADLKSRLKSLEDKIRVLKRNSRLQSRNAITSLNQAYEYFQRDLAKLQRYVDVNSTGFRKILKKYDKKTKENTKELFLSTQYRIQPFFDAVSLTRMTDTALMNALEVSNTLLSLDSVPDYERGSDSATVWDETLINMENLVSVNDYHQFQIALETNRQNLNENILIGLLNHAFDHHRSSLDCAKVLLDLFSEKIIRTSDEFNNRTILHEACIQSSPDYMKLCLEYGAETDVEDAYGRIPLHYASQNGFVFGVELLIKRGSPLASVDHDGYTPLTYGIVNGHVEVVLRLLNSSKNEVRGLSGGQNCIILACEYGHLDVVRSLLDRKVPMEADDAGFYPLHVSCRKGHLEISRLLLEKGHEIDICDKYHVWSPVFHAASQGHYECVKLLVDNNCNVELADENGWLPATYAVYRGHLKTAGLLDKRFGECFSDSDKRCEKHFNEPYFIRVSTYDGESLHRHNHQHSSTDERSLLSNNSDSCPKKSDPTLAAAAAADDDDDDDETVAIANRKIIKEEDDDPVPELALPPPIISPQIHGHASIPDDHYQICLMLGHAKSEGSKPPIHFNVGLDVSSMKMKLSVSPKGTNLPQTVILPSGNDESLDLHHYTFSIAAGETNPSIIFDLFSTFGTRVHARASFTFDTSTAIRNDRIYESSTLYDQRLQVVGKIYFQVILIKPFKARKAKAQITKSVSSLAYWKSCRPVSPNSPDIIIETSLDRMKLLTLPVTFTNDGIPILAYPPILEICNTNTSKINATNTVTTANASFLNSNTSSNASLINSNLSLPISSIPARLISFMGATSKGGSKITNLKSAETLEDVYKILVEAPFYMTLADFLDTIPRKPGMALNLLLKYDQFENDFVRMSFSRNAMANMIVETVLLTAAATEGSMSTASISESFPAGSVASISNTPKQLDIVLSSFDPDLCTILNAKQPIFPVLFATCGGENPALQDQRCQSLQNAVTFSRNCNFLGIISLISGKVEQGSKSPMGKEPLPKETVQVEPIKHKEIASLSPKIHSNNYSKNDENDKIGAKSPKLEKKPFGFGFGALPTFSSISSGSVFGSPKQTPIVNIFAAGTTLEAESASLNNNSNNNNNNKIEPFKPKALSLSPKPVKKPFEDVSPESGESSLISTPKKTKITRPIDLETGEENEFTHLQARCKLYHLDKEKQDWKERGIGILKLNERRSSKTAHRLIMRTDGALKLILNIAIFPEMTSEIVQEKYIRFSAFESSDLVTTFLVKMKNKEQASELLKLIIRSQEKDKASSIDAHSRSPSPKTRDFASLDLKSKNNHHEIDDNDNDNDENDNENEHHQPQDQEEDSLENTNSISMP